MRVVLREHLGRRAVRTSPLHVGFLTASVTRQCLEPSPAYQEEDGGAQQCHTHQHPEDESRNRPPSKPPPESD